MSNQASFLEKSKEEPKKSKDASSFFIGTAGWSIPSQCKRLFVGLGHQLERYSNQCNGVEINSTFYRNHKLETFLKWKSMVNEDFRFSVKLLREFTHQKRLYHPGNHLKKFIQDISGLGEKLGALLVQLPPSLEFQEFTAAHFMSELRQLFHGPVAWEPRHLSWFKKETQKLFEKYEIDRVEADPEVAALEYPIEFYKVRYVRLHGTPEMYKSRYEQTALVELKNKTYQSLNVPTWFIFDNTTFGYATENALELQSLLLNDQNI